MYIKTVEVSGIGPSIHNMRNPHSNWELSDTSLGKIGPIDKDLSNRLTEAGPSHSKHLRFPQVYAEIAAPRFWWTQFCTYRMGMEHLSTSTMHTLMNKPITRDDFEDAQYVLPDTISYLERLRRVYQECKKTEPELAKEAWRTIIVNLPQSFIQLQSVMISYQTLHEMYQQRKGHKLKEWEIFREWCRTLPESWMITGGVDDSE